MSEPEVQLTKVAVDDLKIGMYVSELDIPWLESPFLFQGFPLNNEDEIAQVKEVCKFVYVDPEQSDRSVKAELQVLTFRTDADTAGGRSINRRTDGNTKKFRNHLHHAKEIYTNTREYISNTYEDIKKNRKVDVKKAKILVDDMRESITINPHAMQWLTYLKERHEYTLTHSINVCILALTFGKHLKLDRAELDLLGLGALLHDIGKLKTPTEVLDKPGKLTAEEFEIMKAHPVEGHRILKDDELMPAESLEVVLHHHERKNGQGYPDNLDNDHISLITKMSSIVDVYDAITSDRCYHDAISPYKALQNIYKWAEKDFDLNLVEAFMACMGIYPVGTIVELSDGQVAIVLSSTEHTRLRPIVLLIKDSDKKDYKQRRVFNLATQAWDDSEKRHEIRHVLEPSDTDINVKKVFEEESLTPRDRADDISKNTMFADLL